MKVRCIELRDAWGRKTAHDPWLKLGRVYQVLELSVSQSDMKVRLCGERPTPALFSLQQLEITSAKMPATWVISFSPESNYLKLSPVAWTRSGFWEEYFDGRPQALACFEEECGKILASDP